MLKIWWFYSNVKTINNLKYSSQSIHGLHLGECLAFNHELKCKTFTNDSNTSPSYLAPFPPSIVFLTFSVRTPVVYPGTLPYTPSWKWTSASSCLNLVTMALIFSNNSLPSPITLHSCVRRQLWVSCTIASLHRIITTQLDDTVDDAL